MLKRFPTLRGSRGHSFCSVLFQMLPEYLNENANVRRTPTSCFPTSGDSIRDLGVAHLLDFVFTRTRNSLDKSWVRWLANCLFEAITLPCCADWRIWYNRTRKFSVLALSLCHSKLHKVAHERPDTSNRIEIELQIPIGTVISSNCLGAKTVLQCPEISSVSRPWACLYLLVSTQHYLDF